MEAGPERTTGCLVGQPVVQEDNFGEQTYCLGSFLSFSLDSSSLEGLACCLASLPSSFDFALEFFTRSSARSRPFCLSSPEFEFALAAPFESVLPDAEPVLAAAPVELEPFADALP